MEGFRERGAQLAAFEMELLCTKEKLLKMRAQEQADKSYLDRYIAIVKAMQKRNEAMQNHLRLEKNEFEQDLLNLSIEIDGIVEGMVEDTIDLASIISQSFKIPFKETEIRGFESLSEVFFGAEEAAANPYILVVHFNHRETHDRLLELANRKPIYLNNVPTLPLTIRQHLTFMNKQMLKKAQKEAERLGIQKVWVDEGKIFVQRNDATHPYRIRSHEDIIKMPEY